MPPANNSKEDWSFLRPPLMPGDIASLGGYRIVSLIGQGAMGFVFKAEDTSLRRLVALKVMRPAIAATPQARDRLLREARAAAGLQNDCVVTIHQVGEDRGIPFIAMEFLEGMSLEDWIAKQKKPAHVGAIGRVARDTLRGLAAAHDKGLIHRDIKPGNLWVDQKTGRVKILDFGLTRDTGSEENLTMDGAIMGTPAYMAPEQANGKVVDCRADLFSVGTALYHLATDSSPFHRDSLLSTLSAVCNHKPLPTLSVRPDLPPELAAFIDRLMSKDPANRPATGQAALALWAEVEKAIRLSQGSGVGQPGGGSVSGGKEMVTAPDNGMLRLPESRIFEGRSSRENKTIEGGFSKGKNGPRVAALGAAFALLLGVAGWTLFKKRDAGMMDHTGAGTRAASRDPAKIEGMPITVHSDSSKPAKPESSPDPSKEKGVPNASTRPAGDRAPDRFTNSLGMEMVLVKPGRFRLGGTGGDKFRRPVDVQSEYYIGAHEVTQEQWFRIAGEQPSYFSRKGEGSGAVAETPADVLNRLPVEQVSWKEAKAFVARLNANEPNPGWEYRLPTEIEWEYACRGGHLMGKDEDLMDYYGFSPAKEISRQSANLGDSTGRPKATGSYGPNRLGLFDMHGNVAEWCADPIYPKDRTDGIPDHVIKGGSWGSPMEHARAGATFTTNENGKTWALGFRVVLARKAD